MGNPGNPGTASPLNCTDLLLFAVGHLVKTKNGRTSALFTVRVLKSSLKEEIPAPRGVMKIMARCPVVAVVHKLPGVQVQAIGPVAFFAAGIQHDKSFLQTLTRGSEPTLVACARKQLGDGIAARVARATPFIDRIHNKVGSR